jgi:hypothetical protein
VTGVVVALLRYVYKSKCTTVNICFGLIKYDRNIEEEVKEDITHPDTSTP